MGGGESKPDPLPGHFNIYVTNKTKGAKEIYVRLRGDKLQESEIYSRILHETSVELSGEGNVGEGGKEGGTVGGKGGIKVSDKHEKENKTRQVFSCLTQGGFTSLSPGQPVPFAAEDRDRLMYISVHDGNKSWGWDMPVDPRLYGCVTVTEDQSGRISISPSNPKPCWIECEKTDPHLPSGLVTVYAHPSPGEVTVVLAKVTDRYDLPPKIDTSYLCGVRQELGTLRITDRPPNLTLSPPDDPCWDDVVGSSFHIDLLSDTGYEWVQAQRGNIIPPNAVKTSVFVSKKTEEHYLGRVYGEIVCGITEIEGMINYFVPVKGNKTTSGEILLLTVDPSKTSVLPDNVQEDIN